MEELDSCTSATERYDAFNAMRNRFGGEKKGHEAQKTTTVVSVARRPSRKSDSLSFVKPPIALVQGESESASQEAQERIAKAKEMAARLEASEQQRQRNMLLAALRERPSSASHAHRTPLSLYDYPLDILKEKDGSVISLTSLASDRGYSSKHSSGSTSPRVGSESNLLDDSSEQIADSAVPRDRPSPAWNSSPDYKPPRRFVRNKLQQLCNSEESLVEESPELEKIRQTMESFETQSKGWYFEGIKPGSSPQMEPHQRRSSQVRLPVPDSLYNEIGNEDEDENWATSLVQPDMGRFYTPENSPILQLRGVQDESQESPLARSEASEQEQLESSSEVALENQDNMSEDISSSRRSRSFSDVSRPFSLHQYAVKLQAKKNMRRVSEGVLGQPHKIPTKLQNNPHVVHGAEEVMQRVLKWDDSIGEWVFDGMKGEYSPRMETKRDKMRSREIHFPAPDSAYEPFLSDDESWQAVLQAKVKPGKFLATSPISRPTEDIGNTAAGISEDCPQSAPQPEEAEEEVEPPAERKNDAEGVSPTETDGDGSGGSGQVVSTKIAERAKLFGGVKRAKSFSVKQPASHLATRLWDRSRRGRGSQDGSLMEAPISVNQEAANDTTMVERLLKWSTNTLDESNPPASEDPLNAASAHDHVTRDAPTNTEQLEPQVHSITIQVARPV